MRRLLVSAAIVAVGLIAAAPATAAVIKIGDTVYVDGKEYTWEQWKKIRDNPELQKQAAPAAATAVAPAAVTAPSAPLLAPRAATCTTPVYYDEVPREGDEFQCTAGLGALTREQILEKGWKVDFIEKLPPPAGQPSTSPRGLPLSLYKLVISR